MSLSTPENQLLPRSALRHRPMSATPIRTQDIPSWVARSSRTTDTEKVLRTKRRGLPASIAQMPLLTIVGLCMLLLVLSVWTVQVVTAWSTTVWDDLHYGRPRMVQTDIFVGHETGTTPSHFMALNLRGRIEVIEFPGGDASHAHIFIGPQLSGQNADLVPVTLQFVDTRKDGHPDMLLHFNNMQILFRNQQGTFLST